EPGAVHRLLHHRFRRRLRAALLARRAAPAWVGRRSALARRGGGRGGAAAHHGGAALLARAPRQPAAGLARAVAMAFLLALARGRRGGADLPAGAAAAARVLVRLAGDRGARGASGGGGRGGHHLLHGDDLRLAGHGAAMAAPAGGAGLLRHGRIQRRRDPGRARGGVGRGALAPRASGARRAGRLRRHRPQTRLLARGGRRDARPDGGERHGPRRHRPGASTRPAAHAAELPAARDGLPRRPEACGAAAGHRAFGRLRRTRRPGGAGARRRSRGGAAARAGGAARPARRAGGAMADVRRGDAHRHALLPL
ncbi:MAG: Anaerobic dimethyl sulfoxide reductase chain C, anchor subunit, partial [uncultured Acetobacteraceae bacterium]